MCSALFASCSGQYIQIKTQFKVNGGLLHHTNSHSTEHNLSPALCHNIQPSNLIFLTMYSPSCLLYSMVIHHHLTILPTALDQVNCTSAPLTYGSFNVANGQGGTHLYHCSSTSMGTSCIHCHVQFRDYNWLWMKQCTQDDYQGQGNNLV